MLFRSCRRSRAYLELQMVGGVEESAVAWTVRYYADGGTTLTCNYRRWAAWSEGSAVAWPVR